MCGGRDPAEPSNPVVMSTYHGQIKEEKTCINVDIFVAGFLQAQADKRPSCSKYLLLRNICANDSNIGESRGDDFVYRNGMHSRYSN